jgi:hypothetical protein
MRHGLQGDAVEFVTDEHRTGAAKLLDSLIARREARAKDQKNGAAKSEGETPPHTLTAFFGEGFVGGFAERESTEEGELNAASTLLKSQCR